MSKEITHKHICIDTNIYIYNEIFSYKKNGVLPFASQWIQLEDMLSEIRQT